jgi:hypothetical protein
MPLCFVYLHIFFFLWASCCLFHSGAKVFPGYYEDSKVKHTVFDENLHTSCFE